MKIFESRFLWGGLLILAGLLFLVDNLGIVKLGDLFWLILFIAAGAFFLSMFFQHRSNWWALIPGITLLSLGALTLINRLAPAVGALWGGLIVLGGIGISFIAVYLAERENWWAVIPGGVLLTLALVAGLDARNPSTRTAGIFFLGLGLTFVVLAILPTPQGEMRWAWIPAGILLLAGALFWLAAENLFVYFLPLTLIGFGGFLIWRALRRR
ncbi:MAG: hypothetical protein B6D39_02500 [Anaerolineae bacterium UTCFX2]|jgi:FtsH-binding integral membrane protein|nr:hypothetical protein [Anaerolineales bacterium]OQY93750.1 MAG: hypothetical protein B6D39_02500 [Anaerolineae bacterium UTCFX2]